MLRCQPAPPRAPPSQLQLQVWQWSPGTPTAPLSPTQCATPTCGWEQVTVNGASPPARYGHASGILADKLFM